MKEGAGLFAKALHDDAKSGCRCYGSGGYVDTLIVAGRAARPGLAGSTFITKSKKRSFLCAAD